MALSTSRSATSPSFSLSDRRTVIGQRGGTKTTRVQRYRDGSSRSHKDALAVEEPLEIRVSWLEQGERRVEAVAVTMRTPGHDFDLVAGFLHGEGVLTSPKDVAELTYCRNAEEQEYNVVEARLAPGASFDLDLVRRNVYTTSSCGVCGKASLEAVEAAGCDVLPEGLTIGAEVIPSLPDRLLEGQAVFERTGGLHAAGLFDAEGDRYAVMEDVGRHNAVDKIAGYMFLNKISGDNKIFYTTGRLTSEMVIKTVQMGIPILASRSGFTAWGVDLARQVGLTLIGRSRGKRFVALAGSERIDYDADHAAIEDEPAKLRRKGAST